MIAPAMAIVYPVLEKAADMAFLHFISDLRVLLVFILVLLAVYHFQDWLREQKNLPPGPWGLPITGIIPWLKEEFHIILYKWVQKYGDENGICSLKMGTATFVVLSKWNVIKEAFESDKFVARPVGNLAGVLNGYGKQASERAEKEGCVRVRAYKNRKLFYFIFLLFFGLQALSTLTAPFGRPTGRS